MHEVDSTSWILSILNQWVHPEGWEWLLRERDKDRETDSRLMVVGHLLWTLSAAGPFTESAPLIFKTTLWGGYYSALLIGNWNSGTLKTLWNWTNSLVVETLRSELWSVYLWGSRLSALPEVLQLDMCRYHWGRGSTFVLLRLHSRDFRSASNHSGFNGGVPWADFEKYCPVTYFSSWMFQSIFLGFLGNHGKPEEYILWGAVEQISFSTIWTRKTHGKASLLGTSKAIQPDLIRERPTPGQVCNPEPTATRFSSISISITETPFKTSSLLIFGHGNK